MRIRILLSLALAVLAAGLAPDTFAQQLLYIHADHLNTPRLVTNGSGTPVWRWDQIEPFGDNLPNEDPDGNGTPGHMPLRFPGQYFDKETNLAYNYFRDYDPAIGRYVQSDPIGLRGGTNIYAYALSNPLKYADPTGEVVQACALYPAGCAQVVRICITAIKAIVAAITAGLIVETIDCEKDNSCNSTGNSPAGDTSSSSAAPPDKKNCEALRQSILNTCYGLSGRKRMACFEAANTSYRQCMGYE